MEALETKMQAPTKAQFLTWRRTREGATHLPYTKSHTDDVNGCTSTGAVRPPLRYDCSAPTRMKMGFEVWEYLSLQSRRPHFLPDRLIQPFIRWHGVLSPVSSDDAPSPGAANSAS